MLSPTVIENFGGLDLRTDPEQSTCVDLLNVQLEKGYLRSREGYVDAINPSVDPTAINGPLGVHTNDQILFVDQNSNINAVSPGGGSLSTAAAVMASTGNGWVRFGGAAATRSYYGGGVLATQFSRIDNTFAVNGAITNPGSTNTSSGGPVCLAVTSSSNRLVWAWNDRVWFSDPGAPETFGATNYIDLDPGDGERITNALSWRELVFVFKETKFFVFTGESTDSLGEPVFSYRKVLTRGCPVRGDGAVAGPDGVYFLSIDGVYVTTGGEPSCISDDIEPLWGRSPLSPLYQGGAISDVTVGATAWAKGRLYCSLTSDVSAEPNFTLVWTPGVGWSVWSLGTRQMIGAADDAGLVAATGTYGVTQNISLFGLANTTDNGAAIVSRYRSGFMDLGTPGVEKTIRETELVGMGAPLFSWSRDFGALGTPAAVTLGTSPATARGRQRVAARGSVLSWQVSATSGAWRLNRVVAFMRDQRAGGERTQ